MTASDILIVFTVILFVTGTFFLLTNTIFTRVFTEVGNNSMIKANNEATNVITATKNNLLNRLDYAFVLLMVGVVLGIIVSSWIYGAHPMFMIIYFIVCTIAAVIGAIVSNVWDRMLQNGYIVDAALNFPYTNYIIQHFIVFIIGVSLLGMMIIFAKPYIGGAQR